MHILHKSDFCLDPPLEPDIESVQIVQNSARGTSQVLSGPDTTIVDLLKTMQEQIIVSNKLLSGLVDNNQRLNNGPEIGHWNVRTMIPGFTKDLQEVNDARKTSIIDRDLSKLQMDIFTLQEARLPETGSVMERDFTLFWQDKPSEKIREHGVGFAVRNKLLGSITPPAEGTERILSLRHQTSSGSVNLISAYASMLASTAEVKDKFYDDLSNGIRRIPDRKLLFIAGDFNARVGVDHNS